MENQLREEIVRKCLAEKSQENAIKLLFESITSCVHAKDFSTAESLRDQIFKINPMALKEIIRSAEIIEAAKCEAIDKEHRVVWAKLYDNLSVEEGNELYCSLKSAEYQADATVFNQGEHKPWLYFIDSGRLKLIYLLEGEEVFLKQLGPGELAGQETFLFDSVHTTSMITLSSVKLRTLDIGVLKKWRTEFPVLKSKLLDLVRQSEQATELLRAKGVDRRTQKRIKISGNVKIQLISATGDAVGSPFQVDLCDISQGGLCFYVQITKRETTRLLLGRKIRISCFDCFAASLSRTDKTGIIVAARFHPFDECTVHVRFDGPISPQIVGDLERLSMPKQKAH